MHTYFLLVQKSCVRFQHNSMLNNAEIWNLFILPFAVQNEDNLVLIC